jgi:hypothetical protein
MSAAHEWSRASRHRTAHAARQRRHELVRNGWRANEVRVQRIDDAPFRYAVTVRKEVTR